MKLLLHLGMGQITATFLGILNTTSAFTDALWQLILSTQFHKCHLSLLQNIFRLINTKMIIVLEKHCYLVFIVLKEIQEEVKIGACKHIRSRPGVNGEELCLHVGLSPASLTCQWPLVNSNGSQSSSQAPLMPLMKRQVTATREHFKVLSLLHYISQLLQRQDWFNSWCRTVSVWVKPSVGYGTMNCCVLFATLR